MAGTDTFATRKIIGTAAEIALRDLLTASGGIVTLNQQNHDATSARPGAAVAHADKRTHHLPDLQVLFPARHVVRRMGIEVKAKSPLSGGGWGWDCHAFERAFRWSVLTGEPVLYAIRDLSAAPLPRPGELDDPDLWCVASVWKLMHAPTKADVGAYHYWPADEFLPLSVVLESLYSAALVPVIWMDDGPPMIL